MISCVSKVLCIDLVAPEWYETKCISALDWRCSSEIDLFWADTYYIHIIYILYFVNCCHIDLPRSAYPQVPNFLKDFEAEAKKEAGCPCLEHRWTWSSPKSSYWCFQEDSHQPYSRPKRCKCVEQNVSGGNKTDCLECIPGIVSGAHIKSPSLGLFWAINGFYQVNKPHLTANRNQLAYPSTVIKRGWLGNPRTQWSFHSLGKSSKQTLQLTNRGYIPYFFVAITHSCTE